MASISNSDQQSDPVLHFLPIKLQLKLMPFQAEGVKYGIQKSGRCLVADEMGLGKTLQALSIAYYYRHEWPLLIIVPSSLRYPWLEEIEKWFPEIDPCRINLVQNGSDIHSLSSALITVVSYGLLRHPSSKVLQEALMNLDVKVIVVDESHCIKNRKSVTTKFLVPLLKKAERKLLLTGTPALSRPEELFPQLDAICPSAFGNWSSFAKQYCNAQYKWFGRRKQWDTSGASNLGELQKKLSETVMIRRLKKDVLTQLPRKQRQRIPFELKESELKKEMDEKWSELEKLFKQGGTNMNQMFGNSGKQNTSDDSVLFQIRATMSQLYHLTAAIKIGPVKEYVKMLCDNQGLKFIVFVYHRAMMDALVEQLLEINVEFIRIDGQTPNQDRPRLVHQFQVDQKTRVALLSIKAAGVGLTLTAAKAVVFAELDWTPGTLEQCEDRAHRIGQTDVVNIYYLIARGTLDDWVWSALVRKTSIVTTTLNGKTQVLSMARGDDGMIQCLSSADAYIPPENFDDTDLGSFFQTSQLPPSQKSIKDFFTPNGTSKKLGKRPVEFTTPDDDFKIAKRPRKHHSNGDESDEPFTPTPPKSKPSHSTQSITLSATATVQQAYPVITLDLSDDETDVSIEMASSTKRASSQQSPKTKCELPTLQKSARCKKPKQSSIESKYFTPDSALRKVNEVSSENWNCSACTFHNHECLPFCEMCSSPRPKNTNGNRLNQLPTPSSSPKEGCSPGKSNFIAKLDHKHHNSPGYIPHDNKTEDFKFAQQSKKKDDGEAGLINDSKNEICEKVEFSDVSSSTKKSKFTFIPSSVIKQKINSTLEDDGMPSSPANGSRKPYQLDSSFNEQTSQPSDELECSNTLDGCNTAMQSTPKTRKKLNNKSPSHEVIHKNSGLTTYQDSPLKSYTDTGEGQMVENFEPAADKDYNSPEIKKRSVDLNNVKVYSLFKYLCSRNTNRVYLYDQNGDPLDVNFLPLDVQLDNYPELPDILLHPDNLKLVRRFVREWNSLAPTKRKLISKSGATFTSPAFFYEEIKNGQKISKERYVSKVFLAGKALSKAEHIGGVVRQITKTNKSECLTSDCEKKISNQIQTKGNASLFTDELNTKEKMRGILQVVDVDGCPLCVECQQPYKNELLSDDTMKHNAWATRFCSLKCAESYWIRSHRSYGKDEVFSAEHGICQLCNTDADGIFQKIRTIKSLAKRAKIIQESVFKDLKNGIKERMVRTPQQGLFWQVDHIIPVFEGGGQCDIDNLRTLCTVCHQKVTKEQNQRRIQKSRHKKSAFAKDISQFFQAS